MRIENIGFIGLGAMGSVMAPLLGQSGYNIFGYDRSINRPIKILLEKGINITNKLDFENVPKSMLKEDVIVIYTPAVSYENAFKINSNINYILGDLLYSRMSLCIWSNYSEIITEVEKKINNKKNVIKPFPALSLINNPLIQKKAAQIFSNARYPVKANLAHLESNPRANKIRIG